LALGLIRPTRGEVLRIKNGKDIPVTDKEAQTGLFLLPQSNGLWNHLTVRQHLRFVLNSLNSVPKSSQVKSVLFQKGLSGKGVLSRKREEEDTLLKNFHLLDLADRKPGELSWGQQRRLALARAFAVAPCCLFLDEPFANIDMVQAEELSHMLYREAGRRGTAIIQVTHYPFLPEKFNKIILVEDGKVFASDRVDEIAARSEWAARWRELVR